MTCGEIFAHLTDHGCLDMTPSLDERTCSQYPVSTGGYGDVFRARLHNGDEVAIKTVRIYDNDSQTEGRYAKNAAREIYTWSKCKHPNVAELLGVVVFRGYLAMVSRWAVHGNVMSFLKSWPSVSRCQMVSLILASCPGQLNRGGISLVARGVHLQSLSICAGLAYLHSQNIVHGDLKGANVLIASDGSPMLADFGNAIIAEATLQFTQTNSGPSFSPRWTAPEILNGQSGHTKMADVYSLGMTILEVFTGKIPFPGLRDHALPMHIVVNARAPDRPLDVIPENSVFGNILWAILLSCWSRNAKQRPSANEVLYMLKGIPDSGLVAVPEESG